ncbi:hypothetical protein Trydic_g15140 [Trypoxylus dichotomus]
MATKAELHVPGFKMSKDRVTLLACSKAIGNHKLPLMIIGTSAKPRAFEDCNMKTVPVYYRNRVDAWENDLPSRAILLIDNVPSHPSTEEANMVQTIPGCEETSEADVDEVWRTFLTRLKTGEKWTVVTEVAMNLDVTKESWCHTVTRQTPLISYYGIWSNRALLHQLI